MYSTSLLYRRTFLIGLVLIIFSIALLIWRIVPLASNSSYLPLHYNISIGIDRYGPWWSVFFIPAFGISILVLHTILQLYFSKRDIFLTRFLSVSTIVLEAILFASSLFVVLLNV